MIFEAVWKENRVLSAAPKGVIVERILQKPKKEIMSVWIKIVVVDIKKSDKFENIYKSNQQDFMIDWLLEVMKMKGFRISPRIQSGRV